MSTLKHFPGHGAAPGDSHSGIPSTGMSKEEWAATDGVPFQAGIDAGAPLLMFGHLAYTAVDPGPGVAVRRMAPHRPRGARVHGVSGHGRPRDAAGLGHPRAIRIPSPTPWRRWPRATTWCWRSMFSTADSAPRIVDGIVAAVAAGDLVCRRGWTKPRAE